VIRITPLRHVKLTIWFNKEIERVDKLLPDSGKVHVDSFQLGYLQALKNVKEQL